MKCVTCGGEMRFDIASCSLVCDYCGTAKNLHRPEEQIYVEERDFASAMRYANTDWGTRRRLVNCKHCGAEMLFDPDQMSGMCPYCGSSIVLTAEEAECGIAPNAVIPFSVTREEVEKKFYRWNRFAFWSPEKFRKGKVLGNLMPVYIPYWTFDTDTVTTYSGRFGRTTGSGEDRKTDWYLRSGMVEKFIDDYCICASRRFCNDKLLNSVISFRTGDLVPYEPGVLSGIAAERYTISIDDAWNAARAGGITDRVVKAINEKENADCYNDLKFSTEYNNIRFKCVMIPVWLTGCVYGGRTYNVVASGFNGRGNCNRPLSIPKLVGAILAFVLCMMGGMIFPPLYMLTPLFMILVFVALVIYVGLFLRTASEQRKEESRNRPG